MSPSLQMPISVSDVVPLDVDLHQNLPSLQTENKALFLTANLPQNFFSQLLKKVFSVFHIKTSPWLTPSPFHQNLEKKVGAELPVCSPSQQQSRSSFFFQGNNHIWAVLDPPLISTCRWKWPRELREATFFPPSRCHSKGERKWGGKAQTWRLENCDLALLQQQNQMGDECQLKKRSEGLKSWSWDLLFRSDPEKTLV